jgi:hypothetical protein
MSAKPVENARESTSFILFDYSTKIFFTVNVLSYPGKYLDIVKRVLCLEGVLARVECDKAAAAAHPRRLVAQHVQLVHGTELLHAHLKGH